MVRQGARGGRQMIKLTAERVRRILDYNKDSGFFRWRFSKACCIRAGDIAGVLNSAGYIRIKIDGKSYAAHRLAWLWSTGEWPKSEIDHINRKRSDNRIANLREATRSQNIQNGSHRINNRSGIRGVCWDKKSRMWLSSITAKGQRLASYHKTMMSAEAWYLFMAEVLHGEYASHAYSEASENAES